MEDKLAVGVRVVEQCLASEPCGGVPPLPSPEDRPKPNTDLKADCVLGVRGVVGGVAVRLDDDEDGRAMAACLAGVVGEILAVLRGRVEDLLGDKFALGATVLPLPSGVDGVILIAEVRFTFKANALWGRGLIGLEYLTVDDCSVTEVALLANPLSSFSSSVLVLSFLREPTRGGVTGVLAESTTADLGRYLGKAVVCDGLGRNDDDRVARASFGGVVGSPMLTPSSSTDAVDGFNKADVRLVVRVTVFESPILSRLDTADPMDERPLAVMLLWGRLVALVRRELEIDPTSLTFFAFSGDTLCSDLFITSASALPMVDKFNDCRIEFRVVGFGGRKPPAPEVSVGMVRP